MDRDSLTHVGNQHAKRRVPPRPEGTGLPAPDSVTERGKDEEAARIAEVSAQRAAMAALNRYSAFDLAFTLRRQSVERTILALLKRRGITDLSDKRILDVGCGSGYWTRRFLDFGAQPGHLCGLDVQADRIVRATELHRGIAWLRADAAHIPISDGGLDIVMAYTLFSSVLDAEIRATIAAEMRRLLAPGGVILIHDFTFNHPFIRVVRGLPSGLPLRELRRLFAGMRLHVRRCVLAPPIARGIAMRSIWLAQTLEAMRVANTHYVAVLW